MFETLYGSCRTRTFGRKSKPKSHFLFKSQLRKPVKFKLPKSFLARDVPSEHALTVGELRTNGCYTMFPAPCTQAASQSSSKTTSRWR